MSKPKYNSKELTASLSIACFVIGYVILNYLLHSKI